MRPERATLEEVKEAVRQANRSHVGISAEQLLGALGWTVQEYRIALVESGMPRKENNP